VNGLARLVPRLARDRVRRIVAAGAFVLLALAPALRAGRSAFSEGWTDGAGPGAASAASLLALLLALVAPWIGEGIVSGPRRDGFAALAASRPVPRVGLALAGWVAAGLGYAALAMAVTLTVNAASRGSGSALFVPGAGAAAALLWVWAGSAVLPLSALLDRGEAPLAATIVLLPVLLAAGLAATGPVAAALALLPTRPALRAAQALLTGGTPRLLDLIAPLAGGALCLALGLALAARRVAGR
jgi:hypothetical protein